MSEKQRDQHRALLCGFLYMCEYQLNIDIEMFYLSEKA